MKELKGNYGGDLIWIILILIAFSLIIIFSKLGVKPTMKFSVPVFLVILFYIAYSQFNFKYDEKEIKAINKFLPFLSKDIEINNIKTIIRASDAQLGGRIDIYTRSKKIKTFYTNVPDYKLDKMIEEIKETIRKQDNIT